MIRKVIVKFLAERGLELSNEKTVVIDTMVDKVTYLGMDIMRAHKRDNYSGQLVDAKFSDLLILTKPNPLKVKSFLEKIKSILKDNPSHSIEDIITLLNPILRGWANYYAITNGTQEFI